MRVKAPPSKGPTTDVGLGFDFDWSSVGDFFSKAAPIAVSAYSQKMQIDAQRRMAELQMKQQQAALSSQYAYANAGYGSAAGSPVVQAGQRFGTMPVYGGSGRGSLGDGLPSWALPAAIGGGALLLILTLRK